MVFSSHDMRVGRKEEEESDRGRRRKRRRKRRGQPQHYDECSNQIKASKKQHRL